MALITLFKLVERTTLLIQTASPKSFNPEEAVTNLLTDLRHIADWANLDFEAISERSLAHYEAEVEEFEIDLRFEVYDENDHDAP